MELNAPFENEDEVDGLDLTPREAPEVAGVYVDRRRKLLVGGFIAVVVVVLGFVAWNGLSNAALYFRNADEAVAERDSLGAERFRLQGNVVDGSVREEGSEVFFTVTYDDVDVDVHHEGDRPDIFQSDVPVVVEGAWSQDGDWFESDEILVKHTEDYEAENPDRTDEYVGDDSGSSAEQ